MPAFSFLPTAMLLPIRHLSAFIKPCLLKTASMALITASVAAHAEVPSDFMQWRADFTAHAAAQGIQSQGLAALSRVTPVRRVVELDRDQPEFTRQLWDYLDTAVSDTRVANGRDTLSRHQAIAAGTEQRYGVPAEVLVSIWGIESNYGSNYGDISTLNALATLAHDGRRHDFARRELLEALRIIDSGDIAPSDMIGSWAGAMGHTQFLPSSYRAYAVDGDGDGIRDIWGSIDDVMASTANYLVKAGWRADEPWGVEVRLPAGFDFSQTRRRSSQAWADIGVTPVSGTMPSLDDAAVLAPAGASGPAFLVGQNYRAILRYNNATSYALAVASLADRIAGRQGVQAAWPREQGALSRRQVGAMQDRLNALGYSVGPADGLIGPKTRMGIRAFQRDNGKIPDGFPTEALLEALKLTSS